MIKRVPFFLPTSFGPVTSIAILPTDLPVAERAVLFLNTGGGHAIRPLFARLTASLAGAGHPTLQFDYPGTGWSSVAERLDSDSKTALVAEIVRWFVAQSGSTRVALVGYCGGALRAVDVATREPVVDRVVGFSSPLREWTRRPSYSLRRGVAKIDRFGSRLGLSKQRVSLSGTPGDWYPQIVPGLRNVSSDCVIELVCGTNDRFCPDLIELREKNPRGVCDHLIATVLEDAKMHGFPRAEDQDLARQIVVRSVTGRDVETTGAAGRPSILS